MVNRDWNIREATSQRDWDEAMVLLEAVFVGEGFSRRDAVGGLFSREGIEAKGEFLVGVAPDVRILGTAILLDAKSELCQIAQADEEELRLLAVSITARGCGVGRGLVEECLERARRREARQMVLSTQPSMGPAQRLYESLGFTRQPERDWVATGDSPRWVYTLVLDEVDQQTERGEQ